MSLAINIITPEGQILATDSRQSYRNRKGMARIGSDNASKLFQLNEKIGVAITGLAFLPEDGVMKNISKFIEEFKRSVDVDKLDVKEVAEKLHYLFDKKYDWQKQLEGLEDKIKSDLQKQGCEILEMKKEQHIINFQFKDSAGNNKKGVASVDMINFLVAGYNKDGSHESYICYIPGEVQQKRESREKGKEYGATWVGQTDVVVRIILGVDSRIRTLPFVNKIQDFNQENFSKELRNLEYNIQWGTMTLQDGIDFCNLMIQTTSAIQRFSDGIVSNPGDMPGVGGPVDVAVITQNEGFKWISKKKLKVENNEVSIN